MEEKPYVLNQHNLWQEVARRIEQQLQNGGVMVRFDALPAVEELIRQYDDALMRAWGENNRLEQRLKELRGDSESAV